MDLELKHPDGCTECDHSDDWQRHEGIPEYVVPALMFDVLRPLPEAVRTGEIELSEPELASDPVALVRAMPPGFFSALSTKDGGSMEDSDAEDGAGSDGEPVAAVGVYSLDSVQRARRKRARPAPRSSHAGEFEEDEDEKGSSEDHGSAAAPPPMMQRAQRPRRSPPGAARLEVASFEPSLRLAPLAPRETPPKAIFYRILSANPYPDLCVRPLV
jgi:hypothetical protein